MVLINQVKDSWVLFNMSTVPILNFSPRTDGPCKETTTAETLKKEEKLMVVQRPMVLTTLLLLGPPQSKILQAAEPHWKRWKIPSNFLGELALLLHLSAKEGFKHLQ